MSHKLRRNRQEWENIIDAQASSGLTAKEYCKQKSVGLASFYQWRQRLSSEGASCSEAKERRTSFIDMGHLGSTTEETADTGKRYELTLELGGGMRIVIRRG